MKKVYTPIKVDQLGNIAELTQGFGGVYADAMAGMNMFMNR